ncbi:MAG: hypothetical protein JXA19_03875 [Anaerolineales bacterium]|nr:hypothetical protein [Anaerolineales bacterium]
MKFMVFSEMPVGTIFELSGLRFRKVELTRRPDADGYYNALQVGIENGFVWVKEDRLMHIPPPKTKKPFKKKRFNNKNNNKEEQKSNSSEN